MRVAQRLLFLMPTVSTGLLRVLQLAILLVLSNVATGSERNLLVAGFGLLSSFAMMTDSGAGNFLLATRLNRITRSLYGKSVALHAALAAAGAVVAIVFISYPARGALSEDVLVLLVAFAVTQTIDSTGRIVRSPSMVAKRDAEYAMPDLILFALKVPIIALAAVAADLFFLLLLPLPSVVVAVVTGIVTVRRLPSHRGNPEKVVKAILEYGTTGALSAFYSQSPLLIAAVILPLGHLATLTIVYRIVQALDLLPGTLSLQLIPRVRERATSPWVYWAIFTAVGAAVSIAVILARPLIGVLFGTSFSDVAVFVLVALSFAPKSGNYALVAYLMGIGRIRVRFVLTAAACMLSIALALALASVAGVTGLAAVTLIVELLFAGGAYVALRGIHAPAAPGDLTPESR